VIPVNVLFAVDDRAPGSRIDPETGLIYYTTPKRIHRSVKDALNDADRFQEFMKATARRVFPRLDQHWQRKASNHEHEQSRIVKRNITRR